MYSNPLGKQSIDFFFSIFFLPLSSLNVFFCCQYAQSETLKSIFIRNRGKCMLKDAGCEVLLFSLSRSVGWGRNRKNQHGNFAGLENLGPCLHAVAVLKHRVLWNFLDQTPWCVFSAVLPLGNGAFEVCVAPVCKPGQWECWSHLHPLTLGSGAVWALWSSHTTGHSAPPPCTSGQHSCPCRACRWLLSEAALGAVLLFLQRCTSAHSQSSAHEQSPSLGPESPKQFQCKVPEVITALEEFPN